ncbi:MAG: hypothetical protein P9M07_00120, partial [Candidatus Aceula meridiana]|nr:hypothetical protein [Candidatus Aceula meridiana]
MIYRKSKFFKSFSFRMAILPLCFLIISSCFAPAAFANAAAITNFGPAGIDTTAQTMTFKFSPVWENSWRTGTNNDALWVFVKYYHPDDTEWRHATMSIAGTNPTGFG